MLGRAWFAVAFVAVALAGCAGTPDDGLLDASEAYALAQAAVSSGTFVSIEGSEGLRLDLGNTSRAFDHDGRADGALGDGRLSSWTVSFSTPEALVEARVFGDGRDTELRHLDLPEFLLDQKPMAMDGHGLDSARAASAAFGAASLPSTTDPRAGVLYSFTAYSRDPVLAVSTLRAEGPSWANEDEVPVAAAGKAGTAQTWMVSLLDPDGEGNGPAVLHAVTLAGSDLSSRTLATLHLVEAVPVLLREEGMEEQLVAPTGPVATLPFDVPVGSRRIVGELNAGASTAGAFETSQRLRLLQPDGTVAYEGPGIDSPEGLALEHAPAGTWTLEVYDDQPTPANVRLTAQLYAIRTPLLLDLGTRA